jgi:hypothetical protein
MNERQALQTMAQRAEQAGDYNEARALKARLLAMPADLPPADDPPPAAPVDAGPPPNPGMGPQGTPTRAPTREELIAQALAVGDVATSISLKTQQLRPRRSHLSQLPRLR